MLVFQWTHSLLSGNNMKVFQALLCRTRQPKKCVFVHAHNVWILIILCMCKVTSGPLSPLIHTIVSNES